MSQARKNKKDSPAPKPSGIDINKWSYFHRYWKQVNEQTVEHPLCPKDENLLYPGIDEDDDPMLRCLTCSTKIRLGIDFYEKENLGENNQRRAGKTTYY